MGLPPPKLQDLAAWRAGTGEESHSNEVWEIGVPEKNSLHRSIVLSYLFLSSDTELSGFLKKLIGDGKEVEEIKKKKNMREGEISVAEVRQELKSFNPFEKRRTFFHEAKEILDIFRIFDLRLKRFASKLKGTTDDCNDDFKLNAASLLLECTIEVYFPEELASQKFVSYPKTPDKFEPKIVLFQYENRQHKSKAESFSVFHFAMAVQQADDRKSHVQERSLKKAVRMGLPPPKLQDLAAWSAGSSSGEKIDSNEVWEIGVPERKSLPWSIVLSYLFSSSDTELSGFLKKLIGDGEEVEEIKKQKDMREGEINVAEVRKELKRFNPFKNRHASFHQAKEITDISRIFELRLKRFANTLREERGDWNDDLKLNAASLLLKCAIEVYFPEESGRQKLISYPKTRDKFKTKIVLFQYENRQHVSRIEGINVFHFAMTIQQAQSRKLDALGHFLKKAKITSSIIVGVKGLMHQPENHGKNFLNEIFRKGYWDIIPDIYRSPYIAVKLSEAGFETNPTATHKDTPSALCYATLYNKDPKYFRILYDYGTNCRCLFEHSVRRATDEVLETLREMKVLLESDISKLPTYKIEIQNICVKRAQIVLEQFVRFTEYQLNAVGDLNDLRIDQKKLDSCEFRKRIIISVLERYLTYFYYNQEKFIDAADQFIDYLHFSEYYKNVDNFAFLTFFDNFYRLRLCINFKQENLLSSLEWKMFLAMKSNHCFSNSGTECNPVLDKKECQKKYVLRYIPLLHRNILKTETTPFLYKLKEASTSDNFARRGDDEIPQVIDELLISRLEIHIEAALEVSLAEDGIKAILVIERALQVIGESIKPPSSNESIVSFLLRSRLSDKFINVLVSIRNDISHYRDNSVDGRLTLESDFNFFQKIKEELEKVKYRFEIVVFTQFLRIEEYVMYNCIKSIGDKLEKDVREAFYEEYMYRIKERERDYEKHHNSCMELLCDCINVLQTDNKDSNCKKERLLGQLKAIEYLIRFILGHKSESFLNNLYQQTKEFIQNSEDKVLNNIQNDLNCLLSQYSITLQQNGFKKSASLSAPTIESFFCSLKINLFSNDEQEQIKQAMVCAYEQAIDANEKLQKTFTQKSYESEEKLEEYLNRIFIPVDKVDSIRTYFQSGEAKQALTVLKNIRLSKGTFEKEIKSMLEENSNTDGYTVALLIKITYQRYLNTAIYTSADLPQHILEKLENFLTRKVRLLLTRLKALKHILIDEDEEIKATWIWGRSKAIEYHKKFLMRQRYMRETAVHAALDMAFFDCANILNKESLKELYEKSTDLFSGIDLRNVVAHRTNIPENIGGILDEDDFPSAMIEKMLMMIEDYEAIEATLQLFPVAGVFDEEKFKTWIESMEAEQQYEEQIKAIKGCERWNKYLSLFPFLKNCK